MQFEITKELVEQIETAIKSDDQVLVKSILDDIYSEDIINILYELQLDSSIYILNIIDIDTSVRIITNIDTETRNLIFKKLSSEQTANYIENMYSDDAVDILNELTVRNREEILSLIKDTETANNINELLRYDDDCAGGIMAKELIKANINWNVKQCIEEIRRQAEDVEKIYSVYVVDNAEKLLGRVSLKKIILSSDNVKVLDIYEPDIIAVQTYINAQEAGEIMRKYDLETVPVVNVQGKLVGRITIDDAVDLLKEQADQDIQAMAGLSGNVEEDDDIFTLSKARLPWLIIGMMGGLLGATFMGRYEQNLIIIPALAFFIPLITATGGNVGVQSSSLVVQSLANNTGLEESVLTRIFKVFSVGMINALVICSLVYLYVMFLGHPFQLGLVVSIALFSVVIIASCLGTITPLILDKLGINPALASGPFITTANDLIGLAVYFGVASWLYHI